MEIKISKKQSEFIKAGADEVLFGGAAGGGKSYAQLIDALIYALTYKGSKQLILRRTLPELEKSLIRTALSIFPQAVFSYKATAHTGIFKNGSIIDFAYCDNENDVYKYQSAEYDVIRFDELTHFTESMYIYLLSRLRGANNFPKQVKSSTNPGGVGHSWVKSRFIDIAPPNTLWESENGSRIFIPARVTENKFLLSADSNYLRRLENLSNKDKRALLYGDWDIFEGQFFSEFRREIHVVLPRKPAAEQRIYRVFDYGLDMLACLWIAVDSSANAYVFRELYQSGLIISQAAQRILEESREEVYATLAPPDLWNRRQETGKSVAEWFYENKITLTKAANARAEGWLAVKEWLKPIKAEDGSIRSRLTISESCINLIRTLPALQFDRINPNDVSTTPHELTHAPDALRYFCGYHTLPPMSLDSEKEPFCGFAINYKNKNSLGKGEKVNVI